MAPTLPRIRSTHISRSSLVALGETLAVLVVGVILAALSAVAA